MTAVATTSGAALGGRMTLTRLRHSACPNCLAPGQYLSQESVRTGYTEAQIVEMVAAQPHLADKAEWFRKGWSGCYVPLGDERHEQPVGTICPNCGAARIGPKKLQPMKIRGRFFS